MTEKQFHQLIRRAEACERRDEHLSFEDRQFIVNMFHKFYPSVQLPDDIDDAFVEIIS